MNPTTGWNEEPWMCRPVDVDDVPLLDVCIYIEGASGNSVLIE